MILQSKELTKKEEQLAKITKERNQLKAELEAREVLAQKGEQLAETMQERDQLRTELEAARSLVSGIACHLSPVTCH